MSLDQVEDNLQNKRFIKNYFFILFFFLKQTIKSIPSFLISLVPNWPGLSAGVNKHSTSEVYEKWQLSWNQWSNADLHQLRIWLFWFSKSYYCLLYAFVFHRYAAYFLSSASQYKMPVKWPFIFLSFGIFFFISCFDFPPVLIPSYCMKVWF